METIKSKITIKSFLEFNDRFELSNYVTQKVQEENPQVTRVIAPLQKIELGEYLVYEGDGYGEYNGKKIKIDVSEAVRELEEKGLQYVEIRWDSWVAPGCGSKAEAHCNIIFTPSEDGIKLEISKSGVTATGQSSSHFASYLEDVPDIDVKKIKSLEDIERYFLEELNIKLRQTYYYLTLDERRGFIQFFSRA